MKKLDPTQTDNTKKQTETELKKLPTKAPYAFTRDGVYVNYLEEGERQRYISAIKYLKNYFGVNTRRHPEVMLLLRHISIDYIKIERLNKFILDSKDPKEFQNLTKLIETMDDSLAWRIDIIHKILGVGKKAKKVNIFKDIRIELSGKKDLKDSEPTPSGYDRRHIVPDDIIRTTNDGHQT